MVPHGNQRVERDSLVAALRHRAHVLRVHAVDAVLRRADERANVRPRIAGGGQRVEVRDANVGAAR